VSDSLTFGDLLLEMRVDRGLSQEELAADAQVSVRAISDLERGVTRRPHRDTIRALARALGLHSDDRAEFERLARRVPPRAPRPASPQMGLPSPPASLLGRDSDLAALIRLIRSPAVRLVTLVGVGGVGKTRLAVEVAWRSGFPLAHLLDLSGLSAPDQVPGALAEALGVPRLGSASIAAVAARLGPAGPRLLVLDSAEHVPAVALDVARLLAACPGLTVLATSRAPLRLQGEHRWPLGPLDPPGPDDGASLDNAAVALLVDRARAARPGFTITPTNSAMLAALCRRLDGLPLAIELAAARLRTREPADLLAELGEELSGLRSEVVDRPDRHASLHTTVEWTLRQLRPDEHR
jgi:transcriptional regulator with XRE-family HTH domain